MSTLAALCATGATVSEDQLETMGWFRWTIFCSSVLLAGLQGLRSFMDQSVSRQEEKIRAVRARNI